MLLSLSEGLEESKVVNVLLKLKSLGWLFLYNLLTVVHYLSIGGHYKAYALHPSNQLWYEYDDAHVTEVSKDAVADCEAYVLFYTRDSSEKNNFREQ